MRPYSKGLSPPDRATENTVESLYFRKELCHIINNLFSGKLCNTAGYFYSSMFIFSSLKARKNKNCSLIKIPSHITQLSAE